MYDDIRLFRLVLARSCPSAGYSLVVGAVVSAPGDLSRLKITSALHHHSAMSPLCGLTAPYHKPNFGGNQYAFFVKGNACANGLCPKKNLTWEREYRRCREKCADRAGTGAEYTTASLGGATLARADLRVSVVVALFSMTKPGRPILCFPHHLRRALLNPLGLALERMNFSSQDSRSRREPWDRRHLRCAGRRYPGSRRRRHRGRRCPPP